MRSVSAAFTDMQDEVLFLNLVLKYVRSSTVGVRSTKPDLIKPDHSDPDHRRQTKACIIKSSSVNTDRTQANRQSFVGLCTLSNVLKKLYVMEAAVSKLSQNRCAADRSHYHHRSSNLLRHACENRSGPRAVTWKWLLEH
jgi:hypothetical protein